ncbi:MAG: hypothetical protein JJE25_04340, partial [Bacteroidia bacterium]|nr:hypothetical protein [Bacteroidia bacterium]
AGTYLILPPDKTTIERSYEDKLRNHRVAEQEREIAEGKKQPYVRDERPSLSTTDSRVMSDFIRRFENNEVMQNYRAHARFYEKDIKESDQLYHEEKLEWNFKNMLRHNEAIPIESHPDFREALKLSFIEFEKMKTVTAIETAYENYLFRIKNKMTFERDEQKIEEAKDWIKRTKENLIEARIFAGEPGDLKMF